MTANTSAKPPIPTYVTIVAAVVALVLIVGAHQFGRWLGTPQEPDETPALTAPEAPAQIGDYALGQTQEPTSAPGTSTLVTRGNYTDGTDRLVLLLMRPQQDLERFLADGGVTDVQRVQSSGEPSPDDASAVAQGALVLCGKSTDSGFAACGRLVDETGQLLYAATDVPAEELAALLGQLPG